MSVPRVAPPPTLHGIESPRSVSFLRALSLRALPAWDIYMPVAGDDVTLVVTVWPATTVLPAAGDDVTVPVIL